MPLTCTNTLGQVARQCDQTRPPSGRRASPHEVSRLVAVAPARTAFFRHASHRRRHHRSSSSPPASPSRCSRCSTPTRRARARSSSAKAARRSSIFARSRSSTVFPTCCSRRRRRLSAAPRTEIRDLVCGIRAQPDGRRVHGQIEARQGHHCGELDEDPSRQRRRDRPHGPESRARRLSDAAHVRSRRKVLQIAWPREDAARARAARRTFVRTPPSWPRSSPRVSWTTSTTTNRSPSRTASSSSRCPTPIDLGDAKHAADYANVSVDVRGQTPGRDCTFKGQPILYGADGSARARRTPTQRQRSLDYLTSAAVVAAAARRARRHAGATDRRRHRRAGGAAWHSQSVSVTRHRIREPRRPSAASRAALTVVVAVAASLFLLFISRPSSDWSRPVGRAASRASAPTPSCARRCC